MVPTSLDKPPHDWRMWPEGLMPIWFERLENRLKLLALKSQLTLGLLGTFAKTNLNMHSKTQFKTLEGDIVHQHSSLQHLLLTTGN